ncbi:MAG: hypothetical protein HY300_11935 [Verrucomicrobia bacterium]|nr:hypothetical protein [Verrucomicrobiota bacterium]
MRTFALRFAWLLLALASAARAFAWGPHSEITQAALDALGPEDALVKHLGPFAKKLTHYCWMADYRRLPFDRDGEWFYADDYLLFPGMERHLDHLCPEVKLAYAPYFRRAVQALRTENDANAARWIGSLLHFVEDTGSPPHAAEIRGDVHSKMENWVGAKLIKLGNYRPQLLGKTEDEALAGFLKRMDGLIAFSKERGERCRPLVLASNRAEVEPIVLESALETSRVVADVLHTLGNLTRKQERKDVSTFDIPPAVFVANWKIPVKAVIIGTSYSTLHVVSPFCFKNLPGTNYACVLFSDNTFTFTNSFRFQEGMKFEMFTEVSARANGGFPLLTQNLVRNGKFEIRWLSKDTPDCWYRTKEGWEGELLPLEKGKNYKLLVKWQTNTIGDVIVRWRQSTQYGLPVVNSEPLKPGQTELPFTGSDKFAWAQVIIRTTNVPQTLLKSVAVSPVP